MSTQTAVTAAALVIGDEILSGRTKDKNIGVIADHLASIGIDLKEVRIVGDDETAIVEALNALRTRYDYVFTTGGIGPTHDDITADSIGKAFGVPVEVDERAVAVMRPAYEKRGLELTPARLRMARVPQGADLIGNSVSAAPGLQIGQRNRHGGGAGDHAGHARSCDTAAHKGPINEHRYFCVGTT